MALTSSSIQSVQKLLIGGQTIAGKGPPLQPQSQKGFNYVGSCKSSCVAHGVLQRHHQKWASNQLIISSETGILFASRLKHTWGQNGECRYGSVGHNRKGGVLCAVASEAPTDLNLDRAFGSIELIGLDGNRRDVTELWKDRKVVVAWARHFGCVLCRKYAALLADRKADFDAAGVPLIIIGPGTEKQAKTFKDETGFPGEVYADPTHDSFQALGFASGIWSTINPQAGLNVVNALKEGYRQNWALSNEEDTRKRGGWQQGGTLIVGPGNDFVQYLRKDRWAGDHPEVEELLQSLEK